MSDAITRTQIICGDVIQIYKKRLDDLRHNKSMEFVVGDLVEIKEMHYPWIPGTWVGRIIKIFNDEHNCADVQPYTYAYVQPEPYVELPELAKSFLKNKRGLYLTKNDLKNSRLIDIAKP